MALPGKRFVRFLISALRFTTSLYIVALSIAHVVISGIDGNVGGIVISVYLIPAAVVLFALEFGFLLRFLRCRVSVLQHKMHPARIVALQALGAALTTGPSDLLIPGLVAFGLGVGLMNLVGIYHLLWKADPSDPGSNAWGQSEKSPRGRLFLSSGPGEEDAHLISITSSEELESQRSEERGGPSILSVD